MSTRTTHRSPNDHHVMRSMEMGEQIYHPWLPKRLAEKLAAVLQEIEDDRRSRAKDKRLRQDKAAFDSYYVKRASDAPHHR